MMISFRIEINKVIKGFIFLSLIFILWSCNSGPHWEADVSETPAPEIEINRYEQVLFTINPYSLRQEIDPYIDDFYFFLGEAIDTEEGQKQLFEYITDPFLREIFLDVQEVYPDTYTLETELEEAFKYYKYHFPEATVPDVYTYISGFDYNHPVKYAEDNLIIGIDMYLGHDYENYLKAGIPAYLTHRFTPAHTPVDAMRIIAEHYMMQESDYQPETFLDFMIYHGKLLYFLDSTFPRLNDSIKMPYQQEQLQWIEKNQGFVWSYFIENEMLYSTDRQMINKFIGPAPFTAVFSEESAPRTGAWMGWQIVREYMRRNPDVSLRELLKMDDSVKLLQESRFRPD